MDRDYKTGKSDSVGVFSGLEVEHTPAFGKQTLFLARNDLFYDQIVDLAEKVKAEAIYFGNFHKFFGHQRDKNYQIILNFPLVLAEPPSNAS